MGPLRIHDDNLLHNGPMYRLVPIVVVLLARLALNPDLFPIIRQVDLVAVRAQSNRLRQVGLVGVGILR